MMDRIKLNLKLTWESLVIIAAEVVKVFSYWLLIKEDTLDIYKKCKKWIKKFKKTLWK